MVEKASQFDFLTGCRPGMVLKTRDRREATITAVAREAGLISGDVPMLGACTWRAGGGFRPAPAGAAGPLDLMPPTGRVRAGQRHECLAEALQRGEDNPGCCD